MFEVFALMVKDLGASTGISSGLDYSTSNSSVPAAYSNAAQKEIDNLAEYTNMSRDFTPDEVDDALTDIRVNSAIVRALMGNVFPLIRLIHKADLRNKPIPGYNWCGTGNRKRNDGSPRSPTNDLDAACQVHDLDYDCCEPKVSSDDIRIGLQGQGQVPNCQDDADDKLCLAQRNYQAYDPYSLLSRGMIWWIFCDPPLPGDE